MMIRHQMVIRKTKVPRNWQLLLKGHLVSPTFLVLSYSNKRLIIFIIIIGKSARVTQNDDMSPSANNKVKGVRELTAATEKKRHLGIMITWVMKLYKLLTNVHNCQTLRSNTLFDLDGGQDVLFFIDNNYFSYHKIFFPSKN
jgi:hypothetical protein